MTPRGLTYIFDIFVGLATSVSLLSDLFSIQPLHNTFAHKFGLRRRVGVGVCLGAIVYALVRWAALRWQKNSRADRESLYGLQHGRLHLQVPTPMWMNMGYWGVGDTNKTMAEACRDLLKAVLAEAGLSKEIERAETAAGTRRSKCLIDLGLGCGDQTIYLMSSEPVRICDRAWWDGREKCIKFDRYVGVTKDPTQARYASDRVEELKARGKMLSHNEEVSEGSRISLWCADAAPASWNNDILASVESAVEEAQERWVLALDTAYHFAPSRWPLIKHANTRLDASFMAFDLCLSPSATFAQKVILRVLTTMMGAPWSNFVTPKVYRQHMLDCGYLDDSITIKDVSDCVFTPLAQYLGEQDARLQLLGLTIGSFRLARSMFAWWGRTGVVRGVIVVARVNP
jgi:hypothetical protein